VVFSSLLREARGRASAGAAGWLRGAENPSNPFTLPHILDRWDCRKRRHRMAAALPVDFESVKYPQMASIHTQPLSVTPVVTPE
jgi:hypothetical protein